MRHLGLCLAPQPHTDYGQGAGTCQACPGGPVRTDSRGCVPGGGLLALLRSHQPEGDPGTQDDDGQRNVELEQDETKAPVKVELEEDDRMFSQFCPPLRKKTLNISGGKKFDVVQVFMTDDNRCQHLLQHL